MIDSRIPLMGQQQADPFESATKGIQFGQGLRQLLMGRQAGNMAALKPEERQDFANNSMFSRELNAQIKADAAAQAQALRDQQKHDADIYNTRAQGDERIANAGKTAQETGASRLGATLPVWEMLASTGSIDSAKKVLNHYYAGNAFDEAVFNSISSELDGYVDVEPNQLKATGMQYVKGMIDPKFRYQTADNVEDNATSRANTKDTVGAQKEIAQDKLELEKLIQQQKEARANGEFETMQGEDGITYAVYKSGPNAGKIEPLRIDGDEPFKQKAKNKLDSGALKQVNEYNTQLTQSKASQVKIGGLIMDLKSGQLNLSPQAIIAAEARARVGQSTPNDLAIGRFNTMLNQAVNDILMASKGTQTDGDAQRAAQVIRANPPRDNAAAMQALQNLALISKTNITALENNLNTTYANFGMERPQPKAQEKPPQASNGQPKGSDATQKAVSSASSKWGI